ncbi:MAG TPA: ABC transporter ATP-binding protein [Thermoanaerobaculia bacterium]|jgi:spermidine/putrescine transport system ATP-binding protein|nr:ABC transporter ATP-binding protein [Thermoanaerobaculia bacterium]
MQGEPSVEIQDVTKRFGDVTAVDGVSLAIARGEFFALLGPSGCGKTTLLRMIAGFETPSAGTIRIQGQDVTRIPPHRRPVNMVFQQYALFPHLTVEENVGFGLRYKELPQSAQAARIGEALALVRLTGLEKRRPDQLSGGQRQRVALARALVLKPEVLLLDEPLAALDPNLRREVQVELKALQRELGITFAFVTHDREEALAMSDRIAVMNQGKVEQVGSPAGVFEAPKTEFVARFLGATNLFTAEVRRMEGGVLLLQLPDGTELAVSAAGPPRLRREPVRFVVRPEKLVLRAVPAPPEVSLAVTVEDRVYHGASTEWIVRDRRGERFTVLSQNAGLTGEALPFSPGSPAFLGWDPRHSVVLRDREGI